MRVPSYILSAALLAGFAAAQAAPASQTVSSSPQQPTKTTKTTNTAKATSATKATNTAKATAKVVAKSPFVPKTKATAATAQNTKAPTNKSAQVQNGKQQKPQPSQAAAKPKDASTVQAKVAPKTVKPAVAKTQPKKKEEAAKKQEPKKPEAKTAPVQAKTEPKPAELEKKPAPPAPAVALSEPAKLPSPGKRDPFLNPLVAAGARNPSNCTTGKRCLVVDQIVLKGVVQMKDGNLALVENAGKRPYVLHENDSLYNGSVVKITGDSLILREESNDILGRPITREVVKKVTAPSV